MESHTAAERWVQRHKYTCRARLPLIFCEGALYAAECWSGLSALVRALDSGTRDLAGAAHMSLLVCVLNESHCDARIVEVEPRMDELAG